MAGDVTVLVGPSAVGKGTVVAELRRRYPQVWLSVSVTTRQPRPNEVDGVHYHFIDDAAFDQLVEAGGLLEWASYGQARYGTPAAPLADRLAAGQSAILEIELQGARQVRESLSSAKFVLLVPPSWADLVARLTGRGTETAAQMEDRLRQATLEMAAQGEFDRVIVNDDVEQAVDELVDFMGLRESDGRTDTSEHAAHTFPS